MTDKTIPFRFEDLPVVKGKRVEPATWGPIYTKPAKAKRAFNDETNIPTNAPSGQKGEFDAAKHRAKIKAEFQAAALADRKRRTDAQIIALYHAAMAEKSARRARNTADAYAHRPIAA